MKKITRISVSILLVLAVVFSLAAPTFAAAKKCDCGEEPIIYVAALGSATLYKDADTDNEQVVFRPETEAYLKMVGSLLIPIVKLVSDGDYDSFGDSLCNSVMSVFGSLANAPDGSSTPDITTKEELPTDPTHGLEHSYYFGYDFRADPLTVADDLNAYVEHVKELTGHDKVRFKASSMGGVMAMAYFSKYGHDDIKSVIFQNCPIKGTAVAGALYCGQVEINPVALYRYASTAITTMVPGVGGDILKVLVEALNFFGVFGALTDFAGGLVDKLVDKVFEDALIPVFQANCGIWSFVPDEYYEDAKKFMLGDKPNADLVKRIDAYHYGVQQKADEILNGLIADGIPVMIVSATNVQRTPLVTAWKNDSDGTVDTKYSSVGATVADHAETLPADYKQKETACGHNHISPDMRIDASTCALPEQTWFVKDMMHCTTHDGHQALYRWFQENDDSIQTIYSNPDFPQFLQNDIENNVLVPETK
ncbi:MAG: hypothetical protein E7555_08285 [Ruminococcaceae bacterium]|nr:hypothetical protein [Oscillospiraceae bacterium]